MKNDPAAASCRVALLFVGRPACRAAFSRPFGSAVRAGMIAIVWGY